MPIYWKGKKGLVSAVNIIFNWLPNYQMHGNADKCQLITNQQKQGNFCFSIGKVIEKF